MTPRDGHVHAARSPMRRHTEAQVVEVLPRSKKCVRSQRSLLLREFAWPWRRSSFLQLKSEAHHVDLLPHDVRSELLVHLTKQLKSKGAEPNGATGAEGEVELLVRP